MQQPDIEAWAAWHPREIAQRLAGLTAPWYVAAGWAIDLFTGGVPRDHEDLEIAVPAQHFASVPPLLPGCEFWVPQGEGRLAPMSAQTLAGESHQTWAYERAAGVWRLDVFREPHDGDVWICRRDEARVRRPYAEIIRHTGDGIPYLAPEVVLLFKAKAARAKDERDLARALPLMTSAQRGWLRDALAVVHPGHAWLARC
ncbi:nucleotidyltransferase domain-containing protein [Krasilnikovia sp. MM14-A1259]|uniref:nucleotidyltransferase domain-containing protein n=1 Tax=Krasilnikovia sp. MM14-A1259 TaxID=3373539 RepID=UPI003827531B